MLSIYRLEASTIPPNPSTIPPNPCKYVNGVHLANLTNLPTFHFFLQMFGSSLKNYMLS